MVRGNIWLVGQMEMSKMVMPALLRGHNFIYDSIECHRIYDDKINVNIDTR